MSIVSIHQRGQPNKGSSSKHPSEWLHNCRAQSVGTYSDRVGSKRVKKITIFKKKNCSFAEMSRKKKVKFQIYCTMFYFQKKSFKIVQKKKKYIYIIFKKIKIVVLRKCPGKK